MSNVLTTQVSNVMSNVTLLFARKCVHLARKSVNLLRKTICLKTSKLVQPAVMIIIYKDSLLLLARFGNRPSAIIKLVNISYINRKV